MPAKKGVAAVSPGTDPLTGSTMEATFPASTASDCDIVSSMDSKSQERPATVCSSTPEPDCLEISLCSQQHPQTSDADFLPGCWRGSPVLLLNSSIASTFFTAHTNRVYDCMFTGTSLRFLAYVCNPLAGQYKYSILNEGSRTMLPGRPRAAKDEQRTTAKTDANRSLVPTGPDENAQDVLLSNSTSRQPTSAQTLPWQVTLVGVAQFLDHFGIFYGNNLDTSAKHLVSDGLAASVQAFALQWLPVDHDEDTDHPNRMIFRNAWFRAYNLIYNSKRIPCYVRLYSLFLLDMTAAPSDLVKLTPEHPHKLLQHGLLQLETLEERVSKYCSSLRDISIYKHLLESSKRIFSWYALVRDTVSSYLAREPCVLQRDLPGLMTQTIGSHFLNEIQQTHLLEFEALVPDICRSGTLQVLCLWRAIARIRQKLVVDGRNDQSTLSTDLKACTERIDEFARHYGPTLARCIVNFEKISETSQLATAFLILFWNKGVLSYVELVDDINSRTPALVPKEDIDALHNLKVDALASLCTAAGTLSSHFSSAGSAKEAQVDSVDLPFLSQHANIAQVVVSLVQAIEHCIRVRQGSPTSMPTLKVFLSSLTVVNTTVGGECLGRPAMLDLMARYDDILMDCWSIDPE